jgi:von Willebrand factor A domain-containing protein 7
MRALVCLLIVATGVAAGSASQRVRFGQGVCGPIDPVYVRGATETGGLVYPLSTAEVGTASSRLMQASFLPETILWASGDREHAYAVPVDSTVVRMMFSATFDGTGGSFTLTAPDGTAVQHGGGVDDMPLHCGRIVSVDAPASGTWRMRIVPSGRFWLRVDAKSPLSLSAAEFVERDARADVDRFVRIDQPIAGRPATLRVSVAPGITSAAFRLVSLDARPLQALDLQSADTLEFSGSITLPAEPFRVVVTGRDASGVEAQRIWRGLFHGELIEVVPPPDQTVTAGAELPVTFTIRNHGPAVRVSLVASDHRGKIVAVEPEALELEAGTEGHAIVRLTVPADALPASEASVRLTATSDAKATVGGFNSAGKTFIVVR